MNIWTVLNIQTWHDNNDCNPKNNVHLLFIYLFSYMLHMYQLQNREIW